jgi:hypothetical protein
MSDAAGGHGSERATGAESGYAQNVVAVFRNRSSADEAIRQTIAAGVNASRIHEGDPKDRVTALKGEMREELEHTVIGPGPVGPATKEQTKALRVSLPVATAIGASIGILFGFLPIGHAALGLRVLIGAICGAAAGATVGLVLGGGLGAKGPAEPLAAERGVTVRVEARSLEEGEDIARVFGRLDPIRVDLMTAFEQPARTVTTEEEEDERASGQW